MEQRVFRRQATVPDDSCSVHVNSRLRTLWQDALMTSRKSFTILTRFQPLNIRTPCQREGQIVHVFIGLIILLMVFGPAIAWVGEHLYQIIAIILSLIALAASVPALGYLQDNVFQPRRLRSEQRKKEAERIRERDRPLAPGETLRRRLYSRYVEHCESGFMHVATLRFVEQTPPTQWVEALRELLERQLRPNVSREEYDLALSLLDETQLGTRTLLAAPLEDWKLPAMRARELSDAQARGDHIKRKLTDGSVVTGLDFERWCMEALEHQGWKVELTPASGDQGADLIATHKGRRVVFQCKHYARTLGNGAVQEIIAGKLFYGASEGCVVSSGASYSRSARKLADAAGIKLISGNEIFSVTKLGEHHELGVSSK